MVSLLDLPLELIDQIISILAAEKPLSAKLLHEEPSHSLLGSDHHPLKDLSQTCRSMRGLCTPSLFSAMKVDLSRIQSFLRCSKTHALSSHADSLLFYMEPTSQAEEIRHSNIWLPMVQVLDVVKPSVMTLVFKPSLFAEILSYELDLTNQWAFRIDHQVLQLRMSRDLAPLSKTSQETRESRNVFGMRKWTHCTFNQGSSIGAYSHYEFFFMRPPSIFIPWSDANEHPMKCSFEHLVSLDYVAIFPVNHMPEICVWINRMKNLKCLRVQFAPTPSNDVLDDPSALGKCQPGDLWQEFEDCYNALSLHISTTWYTQATSFKDFVSLDYENPSLRELLDRVVGRHLAQWCSDSNRGRWTRKEEFSEKLE